MVLPRSLSPTWRAANRKCRRSDALRNPHPHTHTVTHKHADTHRHKETHTQTQRHRETQRDKERHRETQRDTERHRETQTDTERHRETQRDTERHNTTQHSTTQHNTQDTGHMISIERYGKQPAMCHFVTPSVIPSLYLFSLSLLCCHLLGRQNAPKEQTIERSPLSNPRSEPAEKSRLRTLENLQADRLHLEAAKEKPTVY